MNGNCNTFEAFSAAQASARGDKRQYSCFIKKGIWYFLCLLPAQLFSLDSRGPRSGQKWGTLPGNCFHTMFLIVLWENEFYRSFSCFKLYSQKKSRCNKRESLSLQSMASSFAFALTLDYMDMKIVYISSPPILWQLRTSFLLSALRFIFGWS